MNPKHRSIPKPAITAIRLLMGALFAASGIEKLIDLKYFGLVIAEYQLLPHGLIPAVALLVSLVEVLCGVMLLSGIMIRTSARILIILLIAFLFGLGNNFIRGLEHECGCFELLGQLVGLREEIGIASIVRDLIFIVLLLPPALQGSDHLRWRLQDRDMPR
ncbi:MAG: DoxX family membrane protein [Chlorobiaceae bacterium]|nr:DoxX family membrane protein [Chlorobiaceae bacterium]